MGQIIAFSHKKDKQISQADIWKAMANGTIEYFNCDTCGGEIAVINKKYPRYCPHCNIEILDWGED